MKINCSVNMISTSGILTQELDPELTSKLPPHHNYTAYLGKVKLREGNILPCIYNLYFIYHLGGTPYLVILHFCL